ncbi:outer membrane protein [Devosia sp. ZW T5_3]|uniref:outer membrane protein n=1 Tax=Devosia sp. ZW T5_3 TaxID=3378085 RepID=UPI0038530B85
MIRSLVIGLLAATATTSAMAADLVIDPIYAPSAAVNDWSGFYAGVFGGYGQGTANAFGADSDIDGWLAGGAVGANFALSDLIVAGLVADVAWSNISGVTGGADVNLDWVGSVRGRIGYNGGSFLPYLTGGLAVAGVSLDIPVDSTSATYAGWTIGAGVEIAATENLSIDLLYRYSDYGDKDMTLVGITEPLSLRTHQITAGLNWSF